MLSRRQFIEWCGRTCLALGITSILPNSAKAAVIQEGYHIPANYIGSLSDIEFIRQIITQPADTCRTIMWQTQKKPDAPLLEYRAIKSQQALWGQVTLDYLEQQGQGTFICTCRITELSPGADYEFRVVSGSRATKWIPVTTVHPGRFRMLIFADSQCENYEIWRETAEAAHYRHPNAALASVIGDLTDNGQFYYHWQGWYEGAENLIRSHIFVPVMGNHECYDPQWHMCLPEGYLRHFVVPYNQSTRFPGYYYSFDYGAVHFIVLNNQFEELDGLKPGLYEEQRQWFLHDVKKSHCPWKVVLMHKDIIEYENPSPAKGEIYINDIGASFMPDFEACGIDLVLTGHLHVYRNRRHILNGKPSETGPAYVLCGRSGDQHYTVPVSQEFDRVKAPQPETTTYMTLDADENELRLQCYLTSGKPIDDMLLRK